MHVYIFTLWKEKEEKEEEKCKKHIGKLFRGLERTQT